MDSSTKLSKIVDRRLGVWKGVDSCDYAIQIVFVNSGANQMNSKDIATQVTLNPDNKNRNHHSTTTAP